MRKTLAKRYRLGARAGEGALSVVYKARDSLLDRTVALKVLKEGAGFDGNAVERFFAEARAAAKITDTHVVAIYDVVETEIGHAIVMEFVDGPTLEQRLHVVGKLSEPVAVRYATQIAQALAAAHALGMLHRDIKPGNVLLAPSDSVKVVDFGLVKALDGGVALTQTGTFVGSVQYVSPEQAQGAVLTPASDLYSLGVVLFQMCSGRLPFQGESPIAVALAHVASPTPSKRELEAVMSPPLAAIAARLLQKDPANRYASARDLVAALQQLQPAEAAGAAQTVLSPVVRLKPRFDDRRGTFAASSKTKRIAAVALGGFLAIALIGILTQRPPVAVADVRGRTLSAARHALGAEGLGVRVVSRASETVAQGRVMAQSPKPHATLHRGDTVEVVQSSGLPFVAVPDVMGLRVDVAAARLRGTKLRPQLGTRVSDATAATIIDEIPRGGTRVREGSTLIVIMATPQEASPFATDQLGPAGEPPKHPDRGPGGRGPHPPDRGGPAKP